jgi:hypothetical protein
MKYLLMIYQNDAVDAAKPKAVLDKEMAEYFALTNEMGASGVLKGGDALHPATTATTVRVQGGKILTTDGPFAETKEQLGGFYLLDCKNLDEAIQWASRIPHAAQVAVEVRPVMVFDKTASA